MKDRDQETKSELHRRKMQTATLKPGSPEDAYKVEGKSIPPFLEEDMQTMREQKELIRKGTSLADRDPRQVNTRLKMNAALKKERIGKGKLY